MNDTAPGWHLIETLILWLLLALAAWAYYTPLDQVVTAEGEVVPSGQVKVIQHLEGGIIEKIHVAPGEIVEAGTPLITLDLASNGLNLKALEAEMGSLQLTDARLNAEIEGGPPRFPTNLTSQYPNLTTAEEEILEARRTELESSLAVIVGQQRLRLKEIDEARTRSASLTKQEATREEELTIITETFNHQLTSELKLLSARNMLEEIRGELAVTQKSIATAEESLQEIAARKQEVIAIFQRNAKEQRQEVQQKMIQLQARIKRASEQQGRTIIRSPITGEVKNLKHHTIGGIAEPAEPLMEIVPIEEELIIEARLSPINRGYVTEEKPARVKISTYDFIRYGTLQGYVDNISADTEVDQQGNAYYRVTIRTVRDFLGDEQQRYPISPGMEATVDIHAGTQKVWEYLVRPVLKLRHDAFREP